jgi:hypothetical protein
MNARKWITAVLCIIAALVGGTLLGIQGNGNWIWSGFFIGAVLAFTCIALLLHGIDEMFKGPLEGKLKRLAKVAGALACALVVWTVVSHDIDFVVVPKSWKLSVGQLRVITVHATNGPGWSFTNTISQIGPIIITEYKP